MKSKVFLVSPMTFPVNRQQRLNGNEWLTMFTPRDEYWMRYALELAKKGESKGEVPIGAVLIYQGEIIGQGYNQPISAKDPSAHAEVIAIREGALVVNNYRLLDTTLYTTIETCMMCRGVITNARIET